MKIGVLTFHIAHNYGAMLQAYALTTTLRNMGYDCEIIDYRFPHIYEWSPLNLTDELVYKYGFTGGVLRKIKRTLVSRPDIIHRKFNSFMTDTLPHSEKKYMNAHALDNLPYDAVIFGSDQIWNEQLTGGVAAEFFGKIGGTARKISYAASNGQNCFPPKYKELYYSYLREFSALGIREKGLTDTLKKDGFEAECVLDPTLLLDKESWNGLCEKLPIEVSGKKYALLYAFDEDEKIYNDARSFAKENNLKLVCISYSAKQGLDDFLQLTDCGPREFVALIKNAEVVFTTSFHGTVFSVIYEKNFFCYPHPKFHARTDDLLMSVGLSDRNMAGEKTPDNCGEIEWGNVKSLLSQQKSKSLDFIKSALDDKKSKIELPSGENCCGCTACASSCPNGAINMVSDSEGFAYPQINGSKCIECGICLNACSFGRKESSKPLQLFAAVSKNNEQRQNSSSGGVFPVLAEITENMGGSVYGAEYDVDFSVHHVRREHNWQGMCVSKYVQSDINGIYKQVKKDLLSDKQVLFTGTPCQVDGLNSYLAKTDKAKLITCDIICHGTPSPKLWQDYLNYLQENSGNNIHSVNFRDKSTGWHNSSLTIKSQDEILEKNTHAENLFLKLMFNHISLRPSCFNCPYASFGRVGDITMGDYWGVEKVFPEMDDNKGTSLVMLNTQKGQEFWEKASARFNLRETDTDKSQQPNLISPSKDYGMRKPYWEAYRKGGFVYAGKQIGFISGGLYFKARHFAGKVLRKLHLKK